MWTHVTLLAAEADEDCFAAEVAGFCALFALGLDELQPATNAAPMQVSAAIARRVRSGRHLGQPDLVIVS